MRHKKRELGKNSREIWQWKVNLRLFISCHILVRKISLCHLHELWEWDAVNSGFSLASSLQRSQYTIQTLQLGKWKPPHFYTITEYASRKPGEEAELLSLVPPVRWCSLTQYYSEANVDLCLVSLISSLLVWGFTIYTMCQGEIHHKLGAAVGTLPLSIYPSVSERRAVSICLHPERKRVSSPLQSGQM